jgi:hypothetical protein
VQRETRERLLVRVVVTEHWGDTNTRELAAALTERLPGCTVTVTPVKSVETGPNGKAPIVIRTVE